ncbi:nitroreductase family protein [Myxococcota bacterium]|nr:nitroreductase family protein [Myxococcota bacterium]MBU1379977.1 nitroreductase family protein [Myxococcota bacterium]MBU1497764.1 nitroreductase family protein [Myxococcota bacterium]
MNSMVDAIKKRTSVRSFEDKNLGDQLKTEIRKLVSENPAVPFSSPVRAQFIEIENFDVSKLKKLGTYGVIKGASSFVSATVQKGKYDMLDFGFYFEDLLLRLTALGFGTCHLGGTLDRSEFGKLMNVKENEVIPCISPVGIPADKRHFKDRMLRFMASSAKRKSSEELFFNSEGKQLAGPGLEKMKEILELVRWAPSASNRQPWRVSFDENRAEFHIKRSAIYGKLIEMTIKHDLQMVDIGIAMNHFHHGIKEIFGTEVKWSDDQKHQNPEKSLFVASCTW